MVLMLIYAGPASSFFSYGGDSVGCPGARFRFRVIAFLALKRRRIGLSKERRENRC